MVHTMSTDVQNFSSPSEEAAFWRKKVAELERKAKETKEEFQEFQEGSRELEAELEAQLEQSEAKIKEYRSLSNRLQMENDQLKTKLEQCHREYHFQISELQTELAEIKQIKDELSKYVRELEQQNDDLERAKRSTLASLEDFEAKMNATIERNAFLESELDEKESLKAAVQRLKDETRDLRSELRVVTAPTPGAAGGHRPTQRAFSLDSPSGAVPHKVLNGQVTPPEKDRSKFLNRGSDKAANGGAGGGNGNPLTPSARISALNIVGDLLRKVGALELKLSSCRNIVKESSIGGGGRINGTLSPSANNLSSMGKSNKDPHKTTSKPASPVGGGSDHHPVVDAPSGGGPKKIPRIGSAPSVKKLHPGLSVSKREENRF